MGMYTELVLGIDLKENCLKEVIEEIDHSINGSNRRRFSWLNSSSFYFAYPESLNNFTYNKIGGFWTLSIRCSLKNYQDEIQEFLEWIQPHVDPRGFAGHYRYEESEEPTLIYFTEEGLKFSYKCQPIPPQ